MYQAPPAPGFRSARESWVCIAKNAGPAPGFRDRGDGTLSAVGNYGCSWSSTFTGTNAHDLYSDYSWLNPQSTDDRALGFQLRCLQK